jgi:biopolymer transport protein ExbD
MHRPSVYHLRRGDVDIKMTPMIDVVFLLLVFFLWTASFHIVEQVLPSSVSAQQGSDPVLSDQPPPPQDDFDDVVVRITWTGNGPAWRVNGQPLDSLAAVRATLRSIVRIKSDAPVILHPDSQVPLGHVIDIYDITRLEGFDAVQFAASESI